MFARCTTLQTDPGKVDETIELVQGKVVPWGRELAGFEGVLTFVDRDSGKGMSFTLWKSAEARHASIDRANEIRSALAEELSGTVLAVEDYELVVEER